MEPTDDNLIALIEARYAPLMRGHKKATFVEIESQHPRFSGMGEPQLSRWEREAFRRGLVEVRRVNPETRFNPRRHRQLEDRLARAFPQRGANGSGALCGLRRAIVVAREPSLDDSDGAVARTVGWAMADELAGHSYLHDDSWVGVGPGQSVYRVSQRFHDKGPTAGNHVTFAALTGRFNARSPEARNVLIDADLNAVRMGAGLDGDADYALLGSLAVLPQEVTERAYSLSRSWMSGDFEQDGRGVVRTVTSPPDSGLERAIVGVGAISQAWRFGDAVEGMRSPDDPIHDDLAELKRLSAVISSRIVVARDAPPFTPIGDIACHLFAVEPPAGETISESESNALKELLDRVNARVLAVRAERLFRTKLWIAAGGRAKAHVVRHVVKTHTVDCLVTDESCAETMLIGRSSTRPPRRGP